MKLDAELMKRQPAVSPRAKEIATFTMRGAVITAVGFMASISNGWIVWVLWISFAFMLFQLGGDYNKIIQENNEESLRIYKP